MNILSIREHAPQFVISYIFICPPEIVRIHRLDLFRTNLRNARGFLKIELYITKPKLAKPRIDRWRHVITVDLHILVM